MNNFDWDKFFTEWKKEKNIDIFVKDGIICPKKYENILFVLKDANNANGEKEPDLRKALVENTGEGKTWYNVCRWIIALLDEVPYSSYVGNMTAEKQHEIIKRAAVINLKKEAGRESVEDRTIMSCAKNHTDKIMQQIQQCEPKLIVVCGVGIFEAALEVLGEATPFADNRPDLAMAKYWFIGTVRVEDKDVPIIQFRHPSTGCPAEKSYNDMLLIKEYINSNLRK